eukprot:TCALIF_06610-PA protein Name:"Protein of unknown function" AED:0.16 eAED:0.54 QI:78/0/0.5/1/0/0/2/0/146
MVPGKKDIAEAGSRNHRQYQHEHNGAFQPDHFGVSTHQDGCSNGGPLDLSMWQVHQRALINNFRSRSQPFPPSSPVSSTIPFISHPLWFRSPTKSVPSTSELLQVFPTLPKSSQVTPRRHPTQTVTRLNTISLTNHLNWWSPLHHP